MTGSYLSGHFPTFSASTNFSQFYHIMYQYSYTCLHISWCAIYIYKSASILFLVISPHMQTITLHSFRNSIPYRSIFMSIALGVQEYK